MLVGTVVGAIFAAIRNRMAASTRNCERCRGFGIQRCVHLCRPPAPASAALRSTPDSYVEKQAALPELLGRSTRQGPQPRARLLRTEAGCAPTAAGALSPCLLHSGGVSGSGLGTAGEPLLLQCSRHPHFLGRLLQYCRHLCRIEMSGIYHAAPLFTPAAQEITCTKASGAVAIRASNGGSRLPPGALLLRPRSRVRLSGHCPAAKSVKGGHNQGGHLHRVQL